MTPPFVHESAYVDEGAVIGEGSKVWHFCHVMPGAVIGRDCSLGQNVVVMGGTRIGDNVKIQNNVSIYEGVELEDDVFCGPSMVFTNVVNPRSHVPRKHEYRKTLVKRGASIGANATIVCGHTIGRYAFIGAGTVVTKDVPDHALVVGNPGRIAGWVWECGVKLAAGAVVDPQPALGRGIEVREQEGKEVLQRQDRVDIPVQPPEVELVDHAEAAELRLAAPAQRHLRRNARAQVLRDRPAGRADPDQASARWTMRPATMTVRGVRMPAASMASTRSSTRSIASR